MRSPHEGRSLHPFWSPLSPQGLARCRHSGYTCGWHEWEMPRFFNSTVFQHSMAKQSTCWPEVPCRDPNNPNDCPFSIPLFQGKLRNYLGDLFLDKESCHHHPNPKSNSIVLKSRHNFIGMSKLPFFLFFNLDSRRNQVSCFKKIYSLQAFH